MDPSKQAPPKRKRKLIEPKVQLHFSLVFLFVALTLVVLQTIVLQFLLSGVASSLPNDGVLLNEKLPGIVWGSFVATALLLTPITLSVGIYTTFKFVGPLHRFRSYLQQLKAGERPEPCRIRKGDQLRDFCELLNDATAPLREEPRSQVEAPVETREPAGVA